MAEENLDEFAAAFRGEGVLRPFLINELDGYAAVTPDDIAAALRGLVSEVDREALTGELSEMFARSLRRAALDGLDGWVDDDLAFVKPWGFELASIELPVAVWQGHHDRMVPLAHGEWLQSRVPSVQPRLLEAEGHISLLTTRLGDVLDDLTKLAGSAGAI